MHPIRYARRPAGRTALALFGLAALLVSLVWPGFASAHEHREVGRYEFTVGFQEEPTYINQPNGVWVSVQEPPPGAAASDSEEHEEGKPVEGLEKTLKVEVLQGSDRMSVPLQPAWNEPGVYVGPFIPTRAGDYRFHFTGTVNGQSVDQTFESGPNRFDSVKDTAELQFPEKVPAASEMQASVEELQTRLDRAQAEAAQARTLGYVGAGLGVAGLLAGLAALASRRRRADRAPVTRSGTA
jgi:hypothetical protein